MGNPAETTQRDEVKKEHEAKEQEERKPLHSDEAFEFSDETRDEFKDFAKFLLNHHTIDLEVPEHGIDAIIHDYEGTFQE